MKRVLPALAGVDGCKAGWVAAVRLPNAEIELRVVACFADLVGNLPDDAVIVVDIPIGLPEVIKGPGRTAEQAARRVLRRASSLFSVPGRPAFQGHLGPFATREERRAAYRRVCEAARSCSTPARAVSQQTFGIMRKIAEVDWMLRTRPELVDRVVESHPEIAFRLLNGERDMLFAKKDRKGRGALERRAVLVASGLPKEAVERAVPRGVGGDDWLDACAMLLVAERHASGETWCLPDPPERDAHGLPIAIRV